MDLKSNTLEFTSRRIARYNPKTYRRNILEPINLNVEKFDSRGLGGVFLVFILNFSLAPHAEKLSHPI